LQGRIFANPGIIGGDIGDKPIVAVIVHADVNSGAHQESGNILNGMLGAVAQQPQVGGMQQVFRIGPATGAAADLPDHPVPKLPINRDIGHGSPEPVDYNGRQTRRQLFVWQMQNCARKEQKGQCICGIDCDKVVQCTIKRQPAPASRRH
jgi:hypothetical protein